jgi:hypothetical protein
MATAIPITVPCPCGAPLSLGHTACPSCRTPISPALRDALDARLESAHADYREARQAVSRAAILLLVLGILHLLAVPVLALLASSAAPSPGPGVDAPVALLLASNGAVGLALLACWRAAKRAPLTAMTVALGTWFVVRLALVLLAPAAVLLSFASAGGILTLLAKAAVFLVLGRGFLGARRLRSIQESLARGG